MAEKKVFAMNCPNCGAPVDVASGSVVRCPYCDSYVKTPADRVMKVTVPVPVSTTVQMPKPLGTTSAPAKSRKQKKDSFLGWLALFISLLFLFIFWYLLSGTTNGFFAPGFFTFLIFVFLICLIIYGCVRQG